MSAAIKPELTISSHTSREAYRLKNVIAMRPGGNITALVYDEVAPEKYREINTYIQKNNPEIEQVMFIDLSGPIPYGRMAGGEFCGNATRSLGYHLLDGKDGEIDLMISGASGKLKVVVSNGNACTQMPIFSDPSSAKEIEEGIFQVALEGIMHRVIFPEHKLAGVFKSTRDTEEKKKLAFRILSDAKLLDEPACGVMALSMKNDGYVMEPFVYVRDVDTFFAETACGSGSVAVGLSLSKKMQSSIRDLSIGQPSGASIIVNIDQKDGKFERASINGNVDILYEGEM